MDKRTACLVMLLVLIQACAAQFGGLEITEYEFVPELNGETVVKNEVFTRIKITYKCSPNLPLASNCPGGETLMPVQLYYGAGSDLSSIGWTGIPLVLTTAAACPDKDTTSEYINCAFCTIEVVASLPTYPSVATVPNQPGQVMYLKVEDASGCYGVMPMGLIKNTADPDEPPVGGPVFAGEQDLECSGAYGPGEFPGCSTSYDFSCTNVVSATAPVVRCSNCIDCLAACGQACGELTACMALNVVDVDAECTSCCGSTTCGGSPWTYDPYFLCGFLSISPLKDPIVEQTCACNRACIGNCKANTEFCNAINLLRAIAGVIAALLFVFHLIRIMFADDPKQRADIKQGIWFVFIGALLILIASYLVSYLYVGELVC